MIKNYESGDLVVVDNNDQLWLVYHRIDEKTYLVGNKQGNKIRLHTDKNKSRAARQDEYEAGRKIDRPGDVECDHCSFTGGREELHTNLFDSSMPLTCPVCHSRSFNGGDWIYSVAENIEAEAAGG